MSKNVYREVFGEFSVTNDDDLLIKMAKDAETIPCIICWKEMPIEKIFFLEGDPYCFSHYKIYKKGLR
jgi:hypothetical protein